MASPLARVALSKGEKIKAVLVGTGVRGTSFWGKTLVDNFSDMLEFVGLCDINPGRLEYAARKSIEAGHPIRISELTDLEPRARRI